MLDTLRTCKVQDAACITIHAVRTSLSLRIHTSSVVNWENRAGMFAIHGVISKHSRRMSSRRQVVSPIWRFEGVEESQSWGGSTSTMERCSSLKREGTRNACSSMHWIEIDFRVVRSPKYLIASARSEPRSSQKTYGRSFVHENFLSNRVVGGYWEGSVRIVCC